MSAGYSPAPGSVAFRALAYLATLPHGAELMTSALAEALGVGQNNLTPCLEAALKHGALFRRQRDTHARSPFWWSLVDYGQRTKMDIRLPAWPEARPPEKDDSGVAQPVERRVHTPEVGGANPSPASTAEPMLMALWSDGALEVWRNGAGGARELVRFVRGEVRELAAFLSDPAMGVR